MFVYQNGETLNIVKGYMPKAIPEISVGFANDTTFVKIGGVDIPVSSTQGTIQVQNSVSLNGQSFEIDNPDLTVTLNNNEYVLSGTASPASSATTTAWGYEADAPLYVVRVVFDGITDINDPEQAAKFRGVCNGKIENKPIDPTKFDGPNYIDYVFDASGKDYWVYQNSQDISIIYTTEFDGEGEFDPSDPTNKKIVIKNNTTNLIQE